MPDTGELFLAIQTPASTPGTKTGDLAESGTDFALTIIPRADGVPTVNLRDVHRALGIGRDFATWIRARIADYGFVEGIDYTTSEGPDSSLPQTGDRAESDFRADPTMRRNYHGTLDMGKELGMLERTALGSRVRRYFIEAEKRTTAPAQQALPADYLSALKALVSSEEEKALLFAKVESDAPRVAFSEAVEASADTRSVTRVLATCIKPGMKEAAFFAMLDAHDVIYRDKVTLRWRAHKAWLDTGDMVMVVTIRKGWDGNPSVSPDGKPRTDETAHFTGKGTVRIVNLVAKWRVAT